MAAHLTLEARAAARKVLDSLPAFPGGMRELQREAFEVHVPLLALRIQPTDAALFMYQVNNRSATSAEEGAALLLLRVKKLNNSFIRLASSCCLVNPSLLAHISTAGV